jgi:hypothetical protein
MKRRIAAYALSFIAVLPTVSAAAAGDLSRSGQAATTPPPGSTERKAILDALRADIKRLHGLEVVFVVNHLKVRDGWAWTHTLPQSPDGSNKYEDVSALLREGDGVWRVVEMFCTEEDNPVCLGNPGFLEGLRERHPKLSAEILPDLVENAATGESAVAIER